jgi:ABC-type transport system involved in multi-copper enzyme maturation permease subunit
MATAALSPIRVFFRFELRDQLRSPLPWGLAQLFALLAFGAAASDAVQIGGGIGNVFRNAPTVIVTWLTVFTLLGMLAIALFMASALLRDFEQGTAELVFASPIRRRDFLLGRIGAALTSSVGVYLLIAAGLFVAQFMPWIDPERLGPVSLRPYLWAFAVMVLPNLLFTGAILALLATLTRSILWVYIGIIAFFVLWGVSGAMLRDLDNTWLAVLADPLGIRALSRTIRYWSAEERNTGLPAFTGYLLANRAVWTGIALAMWAATFALFRTDRTGTGKAWFRRKAVAAAPAAPVRAASVPIARVAPAFGRATAWRQFFRQVAFDTLGVFRSVPFLVLLSFGIANFIPSTQLTQTLYGTNIYPVTSQMLVVLQGTYSFLLSLVVMFYAGELVWRERSAKIDEVTDAMPVPDWVPLLSKFVTLLAVIAGFQAVGALAAMGVQLAGGFTDLQPALYAKTLAVDSVVYAEMAGLALALQVLCNNKFAGYGLLITVLIAQGTLGMLDFTDNLYLFGSWPNAPHSDMNGYGHFLAAQLWFQSYWGVFTAGLLLVAAAFWVRGVASTGRQRRQLALGKLRGRLGAALGATAVLFALIGGFLFWNTHVRNDFVSPDAQLDLQARYEREYKKTAHDPQPKILGVDIDVDLHPETQSLRAEGRYRVFNPHPQPVRTVYVTMNDDRALAMLDLGGAELVKHDKALGVRVYRLARAMAPGEAREFRFKINLHPHGLTNGAPDTRIVDNGTFFNSRMFPSFGYQQDFEISDRNERRKRGLGEPTRMPRLEDTAARANTYLGADADWIEYRTTVCTAPDQIALAPGYLQKEFTRDGRRCFDYAMDRPMLNFYAYLSARWQVKRGAYKGVPIEVYYDAQHPYNVDRMIEATQKSLAYYEANFTPYQHHQVRIVEFPGYESFAQSFANTIPYSESIGFIADLRDPDAIDYVFYVTAHEVAHQWWAHQVIGANVQGATVLSESLAQYSALMVMEHEYGRAKMRRFLKEELDKYLAGRGGERVEELPLYRVENQQYIHYQKGSLVFYRLREELGEDAVNRALKKFLQAKAYQQPPYTTSLELLDFIRAEARPDQQALITDLFEKIAFYDNRVESATAHRRPDGKYEVTLDLHAAKRYADGKGKETAGTLDDWIDVGVFARGPSGKERDERVLYLKRLHVTSETPKLTVVVDHQPYEAGFDPYNKLIDRVSSDNRKRVDL